MNAQPASHDCPDVDFPGRDKFVAAIARYAARTESSRQ